MDTALSSELGAPLGTEFLEFSVLFLGFLLLVHFSLTRDLCGPAPSSF